ncbi:hypothetical protein WISP_52644 [Willisornis vidua]|uniref:LRRC37A/B like protein 1 C-terminal domain-containing protein n=1 Tax=Willisornis vidua TaxID=1566151 RepID=A0ABQ9DD78_9PASS|nr:hypothetical protein WISP_52644 [Willisornis vidua]
MHCSQHSSFRPGLTLGEHQRDEEFIRWQQYYKRWIGQDAEIRDPTTLNREALQQFDRNMNDFRSYIDVLDRAMQTFIAHVTGALSMDSSLPKLWLPCAKMVSKTGLLLKRLSERKDNQGASALADQCLQQGNLFTGLAWEELTGKIQLEKNQRTKKLD